jgi:hypothetical protein
MAAEVDDSGRWPRLSNDADDPSEIPDHGDHDLDEDTEYSRFPPMLEGFSVDGDFGFGPMVRAGMIRCVQLSFVMAGTLSNLLVTRGDCWVVIAYLLYRCPLWALTLR